MAKNIFRRLAKIKKYELQDIKSMLAGINGKITELEREKQQKENELTNCYKTILEKRKAGTAYENSNYLAKLKKEIKRLIEEIALWELEREKYINEYIEIKNKIKAYQLLEERQNLRNSLKETIKEQKAIDEIKIIQGRFLKRG